MAPAQSKVDAEKEKKDSLKKQLYLHMFASVTSHVMTIQTDLMLFREACKGDVARTAATITQSTGAVGLFGLFLNQAGGKLSDATGRKLWLMLGPLSNILQGALICKYHDRLGFLAICRTLKLLLTTFSNSVITGAAVADGFSGPELAQVSSKMGAIVGLGIFFGPLVETKILQMGGHPRYSYAAVSALGALHSLLLGCFLPETLDLAKRIKLSDISLAQLINPFSFVKIFTEGSRALKRLVAIITLQMVPEGKNLSELAELWKRENLQWGVEASRNFNMLAGALLILSSAKLTPLLLGKFGTVGFTSLTNIMNVLGFALRGALEKSWIFLAVMPLCLPGANGNSAIALRTRINALATAEGFGKGEFSAMTNNLRALASSATPVLIGAYYGWCMKRRTLPPGSVWALLGIVGGLLPELMLRSMDKKDLTDKAELAAK